MGNDLERADLEQMFVNFEKRQESRQDEKLQRPEEGIAHQFRIIAEGLLDRSKLLTEGQSGILSRLDRMEKENERQHQEKKG
jgi:hypothetical protein